MPTATAKTPGSIKLRPVPVHDAEPETHAAYGVRIIPKAGPARLLDGDKRRVFLTDCLARATDVAKGCVHQECDAQVVRLDVTVLEAERYERAPRGYEARPARREGTVRP